MIPSAKPVELIVVGGGTAGIVAAQTGTLLGARAIMIEEAAAPGGDCLWTGCVPSKTLLAAARAGSAFPAAMDRVREAVRTIAPVDSIEAMSRTGIKVITGRARLTGAATLAVAGRTLHFRRCILATGSSPAVPDIPGLTGIDFLTTETVWDCTELPERLLILGGGSTGCELAQAFARLGSAVTLVEPEPTILPAEDPEAADIIARALRSDGVDVRPGRAVTSVAADRVELDDGNTVAFDRLLLAAGRRASTEDVGLDAAGVAVTEAGDVVVDDHLRTTNPRIWGAGDLTGHPRSTHLAGMHGSVTASNAVLGLRRRASAVLAPRVTYTEPEVAAVGLPVADADSGRGHRVITKRHAEIDRAITDAAIEGFSKLVVDRRGRILGASVVSPRAGETIGEASVAVQKGLTTADLTSATHPYPTYTDGLWNAAIEDYRQSLTRPGMRAALRVARKISGWR